MFNIQFMAPQVLWLWVPLVCLLSGLLAWFSLIRLDSIRDLWGERLMLSVFSPRDAFQSRSLWLQWIGVMLILVAALAGPNMSLHPQMVPAGAVQVQFMVDVSPSMGAEDYRSFLPPADGGALPDPGVRWGTRLDAVKYYLHDLLPQIENNEAGLITVEGAGYNLWDITSDLSQSGAFHHMLDKFVQVGAAPGAGSDYTSGIQAALDEFDLISAIEKKAGDSADKIRFIVLFTDGGFTGDKAALDKILDTLNQKQVRLLIVAMGGNAPMTVSKYDDQTLRRNGQYYKGTTRLEPEILIHMQDKVKGSELIYATPGKSHISYSFPQKSGGLYARAAQSNLRPWLLAAALLLFLSLTIGGGGKPRWELLRPRLILADFKKAFNFLTSLKTRPVKGSNLKDNSDV